MRERERESFAFFEFESVDEKLRRVAVERLDFEVENSDADASERAG